MGRGGEYKRKNKVYRIRVELEEAEQMREGKTFQGSHHFLS